MIKLKNLLNETTVRISTMKDVSFAGRDRLALYGKKGKVGLDKKSVSALVKAVRNVLGRSFTAHEVKEGKLTEDKFIAFYKKDRVTVNAKSLWDAKKQIIAKLKVPKKDVGLVSVLNKTEYDKQKFRFEGKLNEAKMVTLPNGVKVKIEFKGITLQSQGKKPVFLDRREMMTFFKATQKYMKQGLAAGKVKEEKINEGTDYVVTVEDRKGKLIQRGNFTLKSDANLYIKDMLKKHKLKREKGFWGNRKTGVELSTNF